MKHPKTKRRGRFLLPAMIVALFPLWGCDILGEDEPDTAKLTLEGGGGETIQLVTTTDFDIILGEDGETLETIINSADTTAVSAPYSRSFSLGPRVRFHMKIFRIEELAEALTARIVIDGTQWYNSTSTLGETEMEFEYTFR